MSLGDEPEIIINGVKLSIPEAMTIRVAVGNLMIDMQSGLGNDEVGKSICEGYKRCLNSISKLLMK